MYSFIFQVDDEPIREDEYIDSNSIPEWFVRDVCDYVDDDVNRNMALDMFRTGLEKVAVVTDDKLLFLDDITQYYKPKYDKFMEIVNELQSVTLREFIKGYDAAYKARGLASCVFDEYDAYIYYDDYVVTLDEFIRNVKGGSSYYIGGVVGYHY